MDPGDNSDAVSVHSQATSHATSHAASHVSRAATQKSVDDARSTRSKQSVDHRNGPGSKAQAGPEKDPIESLPLWRYLQDDDWEGVKELIKDPQVDINIVDTTFGWTPLLFAANDGNLAMYKRLVEVKAKVDVCCREGNNALMIASRRGHLKVVEYVIAKKAHLDVRNNNGWSAIIWASINGHEEVATMLLASQANYLSADIEGRTACMWAARHGHLGMVEAFLACGLNLNVKDKAGLTVFDHAAEHLDMRTTIGAVEQVNRSLLECAKRNDTEGVREAIEAGADLDMRDEEGFSALMWAALNNSLDMVELVVRHGANPSLLIFHGDEMGGPSDHLAVGDAIEAILGSNDRLLAAAMENDWDGVDAELRLGAFINVQDEKKQTAMMWAARLCNPTAVSTLASKNAPLDERDSSGWAAVHFAVAAKSAETVSMLHYLGADFSPRTYEGDTLLHMATRANDGVMIQVLLAAKSNIEEQDVDDQTSLMIASINGLELAVRTLLSYGANWAVVDHLNRSPCALAVVHSHAEVVDVVLQHPKAPPLLPGEVTETKPAGKEKAKSSQKPEKEKEKDAKGKAKAKAHASSKDHASSKEPGAASGSKSAPGGAEKRANSRDPSSAAKATGGVLAKKKIITRTGPEKQGEDPLALLRAAVERKPGCLQKAKDPIAKAVMKQADSNGRTPLSIAVHQGDESIMSLLLNAKADVQAVNNKGNSILFEAVATNSRWMVDKILELGAKVDIKNKAGQRPVDICTDEVIRQMLNRRLVEAKIPADAPAGGEEEEEGEEGGDGEKKPKRKRSSVGKKAPSFRIRVEQLPRMLDEKQLERKIKQTFAKLGTGAPDKVKIVLDPITYTPLGHAYVDFSTAALADLAVRGDGQEMAGTSQVVRVFREIDPLMRLPPIAS